MLVPIFLKKLKPKTCPRIQVGKNAKCDIIHSFCFEVFFLSITSAIYLKPYIFFILFNLLFSKMRTIQKWGIFEFQLDDKEQSMAMLKGLYMIFSGHENPFIFFRGNEKYI